MIVTPRKRKRTVRVASGTAATLGGLALGLGLGHMATVGTEAAYAKPCGKHANEKRVTRKACLAQLKRNRMAWPDKPKAWEIKRRVGSYNWNKARQVAICETGMNLNHYPSGTYRGPLGMYVRTQQFGMRATGYTNPTTWQEHVAIAVASHPITRGWSGWGCA